MVFLVSNLRNKYISLYNSNNTTNEISKFATQIVILQIVYYLSALVMFFLTFKLLGWDFSGGILFSWSEISIQNSFGLTLMFLWLLNSLLSVIFLSFLIGRSKLAWDFAVTIQFIHLCLVTLASGVPKNIFWWVSLINNVIVMVLLGTYLSRWVELRDTFFENMTDIEMGSK